MTTKEMYSVFKMKNSVSDQTIQFSKRKDTCNLDKKFAWEFRMSYRFSGFKDCRCFCFDIQL